MIPEATHNEVVALTGSIGSGKSTVGKLFKQLGAAVIDADVLARQAVEPGTAALAGITAVFGADVLTAGGSLDRGKMAQLIFNRPELRAKLEEITHPVIRQLSETAFAQALADGAPLVVYECPLLFEKQLDHLGFKAIIVVAADDELAVQRIAAREGISSDEALKRLRSQLPVSEKVGRADFVLDNNGSLEDLRLAVEKLYGRLTA